MKHIILVALFFTISVGFAQDVVIGFSEDKLLRILLYNDVVTGSAIEESDGVFVSVNVRIYVQNNSSETIDFPACNGLIVDYKSRSPILCGYRTERLGDLVVKPKPSDLNVVSLLPGEMFLLLRTSRRAPIDAVGYEFKYTMDPIIKKYYKVWAGEIQVPVMLGDASGKLRITNGPGKEGKP